MIAIPLQPIPAQDFSVTLGDQPCRIVLYQKGSAFYMNLTASGNVVVQGRMVLNNVWIVRYAYLGLIGDLVMLDTTGTADSPTYDGLGSRYQLCYAAPGEIASAAS